MRGNLPPKGGKAPRAYSTFTYDGLGRLAKSEQHHTAAVGQGTPAVEYAYAPEQYFPGNMLALAGALCYHFLSCAVAVCNELTLLLHPTTRDTGGSGSTTSSHTRRTHNHG